METYSKIANFLAGNSGKKEKEELEEWRKAQPENEEDFLKFQRIWNAGKPSASFNPDVDKAWEKVSSCIFAKDNITTPDKSRFMIPASGKTAWKIAAAVSLVLLSGLVFLLLNSPLSGPQHANLLSLETSTHQKQEIVLSDGTHIWLNKESSLTYPKEFTDSTREVYLTGEAFFEVEPIKEKPFIIHFGAGKVQVLGTAFNLQAKTTGKVKLQVTEGRVKFSVEGKPGSALEVGSGEAAELSESKIKTLAPDVNFLSWKTGEFVFADKQLKEVLQTLESYYPVKLKAADPLLLKCRISARFKDQPLEEVLKIMDITLNLSHSSGETADEIVFMYTGKGPHCAGENL